MRLPLLASLLLSCALPAAAFAQAAAPIVLTPQASVEEQILPQDEATPAPHLSTTETVVEQHADGSTVETTTTIEHTRLSEDGGTAITPVDGVQSNTDFIAFASEHCRAFIGDGTANLGFALSKRAAAKFSFEERAEFNQQFAQKLIQQYKIDASKPCVLNTVSMKPVRRVDHSPKTNPERGVLPKAKQEIAVVNGQLPTTTPDVFVSVAYRLERVGASPWTLTNITFNGQPLVDRYRAEYDVLAAKGGPRAVLNNL
ncbi:MAG: ABC transporter substrate-binding protein [Alphaproteobacteria bacterium]|nr:ABC transporter substrate-binding protein [Alphaproteobacteria bacterium]